MSTIITNTIVVVNDEGDIFNIPQTSISSIIINQTQLPPVLLTYSSNIILITRKTTDPIVITKLY